jgi:hypothetical protein
LIIQVVFAAGIALGGLSGINGAAAEDAPTRQSLVNRSETPVSETDGIADREQLRRHFFKAIKRQGGGPPVSGL